MTITAYANAVDPCDRIGFRLDGSHAASTVHDQLRLRGFGVFRAEVDGTKALLPPITRTVLARLALVRGGLVEIDDLYRDSWPEPTVTVRREQRVAVHKRIAELRRCLASQRSQATTGGGVLLTERSARTGYRLLLEADQFDLHTFSDLVYRAGAAQDVVAVDLLVQALLMWTEQPLLGLPDTAFVCDHVARLVRLRDRACRELAAGCQRVGRIRDALAVFDHLQAIHPADFGLRELIEQEMAGRLSATSSLTTHGTIRRYA